MTNLGYEKEVTLLSAVRVPDDAKARGSFPIRAKVNWLVCQEVCIPQEVPLELVLPIVQKGSATGAGSPLIAQAQARLPMASPWPVQIEQRADKLGLKVTGPELQSAKIKDLLFYPAKWGRWFTTPSKLVATKVMPWPWNSNPAKTRWRLVAP